MAGSDIPSDARPERPSFAESAAFGVMSFAAMVVLGLASAIATARVYGISVMGEFALASAPTGAVWYLSTVREQPALVREIMPLPIRSPRITGLWVAVFSFSFTLTLVVSVLALVVTWFLFHGPIGHPELFLPATANLAGYVLVTNTCWNLDTIFTAFRDGRQLFWIRLHQAAAYLVFAVTASFVLGTVWGPVLATIASWLTALIHRVVAIRHWMPVPVHAHEIRRGFKTLPEMLRFGLRVTPGTLADGVGNESGTWTLGLLGSITEIGAYNRAWTLARKFVELNWRITEMLFPTLVERHNHGDKHGFDGILVDTLRYVAVGMLIGAAAGGGAAKAIMGLFGPGFGTGAGALTLILFVPCLATIIGCSNAASMARGRPWLTSKVTTLRMLVTLVAVPLFTLAFGITGTALGVVCGYFVDCCVQLVIIDRYVATPFRRLWRPREVIGLLGACAAGFAASRGVSAAIPGLAGLLPALLAGAVCYVGVYVGVGGLAPQDVRRLAQVRGRLGRLMPSRTAAPVETVE